MPHIPCHQPRCQRRPHATYLQVEVEALQREAQVGRQRAQLLAAQRVGLGAAVLAEELVVTAQRLGVQRGSLLGRQRQAGATRWWSVQVRACVRVCVWGGGTQIACTTR